MVPEGWRAAVLRELCVFEYGKSLPATARQPGLVQVYGSNGAIGEHNKALVPGPGIVVGRKGSIGEVVWSQKDFWPIDTTYYVAPRESADLRWLFRVLRWLDLRTLNTATGIPGLNREDAYQLGVPVPPLPEQRKIAAILSSIDDAIEATQAVIDQLHVVKKAMMTELLTRGLPGRHTRFKQTEIGEVPEGWEVVHAGDVCSLITKGATPSEQTRDQGNVPFLKVYNLDPKGFIDFTYQPTFIPMSVHKSILNRSRVFPGDVLMNIVGPPLGKIAVVSADFPESNINQAIAVFRPNKVEPFFLATCLAAPHLFAWAATQAKRTSTQLNLTLEICRDYPIPLPPADERAEMIQVISATDARIDAELKSLKALIATKSALSSALLTGEIRVQPDEATP